jgi:SAM-dependent methyltransferase
MDPAPMSSRLLYFAKRIVAFYRGNFSTNGVRGVARVSLALAMTAFSGPISTLGAQRRHCPCCGWRGSRFLPFLATGYIAFETLCPVCSSAPRHRAHRIFYQQHLGFDQRHGRLLYFAPEHNLHYFRKNPRLEVKTSNYPARDADYCLDILDMPFDRDEWDYIICHRVIEHLSDDRRGMEAFLKILKPGGFAVISVPMDATVERTIDYGKPNPLENEHYYYYGADFIQRIPKGFQVESHRFSETFSPEQHEAMALIDDFIFVCRKPLQTASSHDAD